MENLKIITQKADKNSETLLDSIGKVFKNDNNKTKYDTMYIVSAFASGSGFEALKKEVPSNIKLKICVGVNNGVTDRYALNTIFNSLSEKDALYCYINDNDKSFLHSKIYRAENTSSEHRESLTFIASNNMTECGLSENIESYVAVNNASFKFDKLMKNLNSLKICKNKRHKRNEITIDELYKKNLLKKSYRRAKKSMDDETGFIDAKYFWFQSGNTIDKNRNLPQYNLNKTSWDCSDSILEDKSLAGMFMPTYKFENKKHRKCIGKIINLNNMIIEFDVIMRMFLDKKNGKLVECIRLTYSQGKQNKIKISDRVYDNFNPFDNSLLVFETIDISDTLNKYNIYWFSQDKNKESINKIKKYNKTFARYTNARNKKNGDKTKDKNLWYGIIEDENINEVIKNLT